MADENSAELLAELNRKRRLWRWGPIALGLGLTLLFGALVIEAAVLVGLSVVSVVGAIAVWILEVRRKTTALFYQLEPPVLSAVERLHTALDSLASCQRIWLVEARDATTDRTPSTVTTSRVRRKLVQLRESTPPFVKTNIRPLLMPAGRQQLFFLPDRLLVLAENGYGAVPYEDLSCEIGSTRFVEEGGAPSDSRRVDHTWKRVTKKGEPDRRFRDNPQIPIVNYGELTLRSTTGLNESWATSKEHKIRRQKLEGRAHSLSTTGCRTSTLLPMDHPRSRARLTTRPSRPARPIKWYQLKVTLECTNPAVWRRIAVRGDVKLDLLHAVLQLSMGWTNSHLHMFLIGADRYSEPSMIDNPGWGGDEDKDERKLSLAQVVDGGFSVFGYEYDFGDSWTHLLVVEKELPPDPASKAIARCLDGARACPPEDCGGFPGFEQLLKVMKNPKHREYRSMVEWLGAPFDPEAFDLKETNLFLKRLKWPRTSVEQLADILLARHFKKPGRGAA